GCCPLSAFLDGPGELADVAADIYLAEDFPEVAGVGRLVFHEKDPGHKASNLSLSVTRQLAEMMVRMSSRECSSPPPRLCKSIWSRWSPPPFRIQVPVRNPGPSSETTAKYRPSVRAKSTVTATAPALAAFSVRSSRTNRATSRSGISIGA